MPDAPPAWFIAAAIAGALAYGLRKLIVYGSAAVGIGMAILNNDGETTGDGSKQAAVVPAPLGRAAAQPNDRVIGLCLRNSTEAGLDYTYALPDGRHSDEKRISPGEERKLWAAAQTFEVPPARVIVFIKNVGMQWDLPLGYADVAVHGRNIQATDVSCGRNGLRIHEIFQNKGELWIRKISA